MCEKHFVTLSACTWMALGGAATLETFPAPIASTISLFNENARACAGPLIPKIQFNGIGGPLTYISLTPNSVVSALRFLWRSGYRTAAASDVHRTAPKRHGEGRGCNC